MGRRGEGLKEGDRQTCTWLSVCVVVVVVVVVVDVVRLCERLSRVDLRMEETSVLHRATPPFLAVT